MTNLQTIVLNSILRNDFTQFNGGLPGEGYAFNQQDFLVWTDCIDNSPAGNDVPKGKALSGVLSSLHQAGLVNSDDECTSLTAKGFDAFLETLHEIAGKVEDLKNEVEAVKDEEQEGFDNLSEGLQQPRKRERRLIR
jgi:hypothetical protein